MQMLLFIELYLLCYVLINEAERKYMLAFYICCANLFNSGRNCVGFETFLVVQSIVGNNHLKSAQGLLLVLQHIIVLKSPITVFFIGIQLHTLNVNTP